MNNNPEKRYSAVNDFYRARSQATLKEIIARFTGSSTELLSYEDVRQKLRAQISQEKILKDIPLDAIVGSVGRYSDFTRDFLPRRDTDKERWTRVQMATFGMMGLPPIDVYQIGDVYFVIDGNHRVSVSRQLGATYIQAYVTEVRSRVKLTPDVRPDDLIIKAEYANFLEKTRLDERRPGTDFTVTTPGKYPMFEEHIEVHRYYMGIEQQREIPYGEAVTDWVDTVYLPVVETIRDSGILRYFPGRTESDLYLWIAKYQKEIEEQLGFSVRPETALINLSMLHGASQENFLSRLGSKLRELIVPKRLEAGPEPGQWRREILAVRRDDHLFPDILVPIDGRESGWFALEQALVVAQREKGKLDGLYIVSTDADLHSPATLAIKDEFQRRSEMAGIQGQLAVSTGDISDEICRRAVWTDLVVTNLSHPPGYKPLDRLDSGFQKIVQQCPRPILATPRKSSPLQHALLAYDGSLKAEEGLYLSAYFAEQWDIRLSVVTVFRNGRMQPETLLKARVYLEEHGVDAEYFARQGDGDTVESILQIVEDEQIDLIITGGYGMSPVVQVVTGSTVDQLLRHTPVPVLICR